MPRPLTDVPVPAGVPAGDLAPLLRALDAALAGSGPAVRLRDGSTPAPDGPAEVDDEVAVVVATSGSTGRPRDVGLSAAALRAGAQASAARVGGDGRWLLALPVHHVAGLMVLVRALLAGTVPTAVPGPFRAGPFAAAAAGPAGASCSLVPTQLRRVLASPDATDALRGYACVLVGGAALPADLHGDALRAGLPVVVTYGSTETCGGCVYDGRPLDGVRVRAVGGRLQVAGPTLALGYLDGDDGFSDDAGARWFVTSDLGEVGGDGRVTVLGRADDALLTGGVTVAPAAVEAALAGVPGVAEVCVVGLPDPHWGQLVTVVLVGHADLAALRAAATARLGVAAAPRAAVSVDALPLRGPGKPDRRATAELAAGLLAAGSGQRWAAADHQPDLMVSAPRRTADPSPGSGRAVATTSRRRADPSAGSHTGVPAGAAPGRPTVVQGWEAADGHRR